MYTIALGFLILFLFIYIVLNLPVFGKLPQKERLRRIKSLATYADGEIKNLSLTPTKPADISYFQILANVLRGNEKGTPPQALPHIVPDLTASDGFKMTWFGHSSYLLQVEGKNILVDPVFSERTSPFQFLGTKRFEGTDFIQPEDFPAIDLLILTHDHYDHLDYSSILKFKAKTTHFLTSLGVGAHLQSWGIPSHQFTELAWGESASPIANISFTAVPARHFSGRRFKRNQSLWSSFVMQTKNNRIFIGGDSGYDYHFKEIGEKYGPFDLVLLECGQYNTMWPLIHMFPEQVVQAAIDLKAAALMPVHWGKFRLALHDWDDPIKRVVAKSEQHGIVLATPMLGESFYLNTMLPSKKWWLDL